MSEDIFETIADLEKRADEVVVRAREEAKKLRAEVERKLKALADELEQDFGKNREEIERELARRREQILKEFEERLRAGMAKLDTVRREKVGPLIEHVIRAFMEHTDVH